MQDAYDIVIAGGGLVGTALACALGGQGLSTLVVEPAAPEPPAEPGYDDRVIALAEGSRRILQDLGVWDALRSQATPIRRIHISERGGFGATRLSADAAGVTALGYVIEARDLGPVLQHAAAAADGVALVHGARVVGSAPSSGGAWRQVTIATPQGNRECRGRVLVAADGGDSPVRALAGIGSRERPYHQTAIIANVTPSTPHHGQAYERFTDSGPLALLPMTAERCALVMSVGEAQVDHLMVLDDAAFLAHLQERFGDRLGRFVRVGRRAALPLRLVQSRAQVAERLVVIGNAAHSLHPVAGQGLNLGLRDVAALAENLVAAQRDGQDIGARAVLDRYAAARTRDQRLVSGISDQLVRVFSNRIAPLWLARNLGLSLLEFVAPGKRLISRHAMGLVGRRPRLGRGLPL